MTSEKVFPMAAADLTVGVRTPSRGAGVPTRLAGAGGLVFLVLVAFQNVLRAAEGPATDATPQQVLAFFADQAWTVHVTAVTYVLGFVPLFSFAAGISEHAHADPRARLWARIGTSSVGVVAVLFGLINVLQVVLVAANSALRTQPALAQALWSTHNAVFTFNLVAVGGALAGLGLAAAGAGLVPSWMRPAVVVGAVLLAVAALPTVAEVHGSTILGVGLIGFLVWLVFLAVAGVRMLRGAR
jgi:hypothetical protein